MYDHLGVLYPAVCANGAVVYDPAADRALHVNPLAPAVLAEACASGCGRRFRTSRFAVEIEDGRSPVARGGLSVAVGRDDPAVRPVAVPPT